MLPTSAGVEPATSWSPVGRRTNGYFMMTCSGGKFRRHVWAAVRLSLKWVHVALFYIMAAIYQLLSVVLSLWITMARNPAGNFRRREKKKTNEENIEIRDFVKPLDLFLFFISGDDNINRWCRRNGMLANSIECSEKVERYSNSVLVNENCDEIMAPSARLGKPTGSTLHCKRNESHEKGARVFAFFEGAKSTILDVMVFIKSYLDKCSLLQCSLFPGISYKSTGSKLVFIYSWIL